MMWAAGSLASMASLTYPAISALVSCNSESDQQGTFPHEDTFINLIQNLNVW